MPPPARGHTAWRTRIRRIFVFAVPSATAIVLLGHPTDPTAATDLGDRASAYIALHVALLFMLPLLGVVLWLLLRGLSGPAAAVARGALPVALVFYAAFDALVGIAGGILSREAVAMTGEHRPGAVDLTERWLQLPMPIPIVSTLGVLSWTTALLAAALAHYRAGASWVAVAGLTLAGPLFGFGHPLVTGVVGMGALLAAALAIELGRPRSRPSRD